MGKKLTREELLVLLIEECGEAIQAATKCLRFGYERFQPEYGQNNLVLAKELGEVFAVVNELDLNREANFTNGQIGKIARAEDAKEKYGVSP